MSQQVQDFYAWRSGQEQSGLTQIPSGQDEHVFKIQSNPGDSQALQDFIAWIATEAPVSGSTPLESFSEHILVGNNCTADGSLARFAWELCEFVHKWRNIDTRAALAYLYSQEYDGAELNMQDVLTLTARLFDQTFKHFVACGGTGELYDAACEVLRKEVLREDEDVIEMD
jgi:hypothetical protein